MTSYTYSDPGNISNQSVYHNFCSTCGIHIFINGNVEFLGGIFVVLNLNAVDWKQTAVDFRALTKPDNITYTDGAGEWAMRTGEPFAGQAW